MNCLSRGSGCLSKAWAIYVARHRLFAASLSACVTNAYQAWRQVHALTSAEYPQNQFKLDLAQSLFQMMRELRAGRSSRRPSEERSKKEKAKEAAPGGSSPSETFHWHRPMKSEKRLLCDLCKDAQTSLRCQQCGVHFCNPAAGRQCMVEHMAEEVAVIATCMGKQKRSY
jgi:hypothetical protein